MPIPRKRIKIELKKINPSVLTPEKLKEQLNDVGLACKDTSLPRLEKFIEEVNARIPSGVTESFAILEPAKKPGNRLEGLAMDWESAANGNWQIMDYGYAADLEYIQYKEHFEWLLNNRPSFTGRAQTDNYERQYETVDSIKNFFADVTTSASSAVIKGVNKDALKAAMSNAISPLDDKSAKDYDKRDSRVMFLVDNYSQATNEADAIGVLAIDWHLIIKDYQVKKEALKHKTTLEVNIRVVLYDSLDALDADLKAAKAHFGNLSFGGALAIPPKDTTIKIYDKQPPADAETFKHSLPIKSVSDYLDVLVLFAPDLQIIGTIDNTNSSVATTYSKSVTTGFTFSSTQSLAFKAGFDAGVVFAKASFEFTFTISFTEQYSRSSTETISFSVPKAEKAFLYQGTLLTRVLRYDPAKDNYTYLEGASFLTEIFDTFKEAIPNKPPVLLRQFGEEEKGKKSRK